MAKQMNNLITRITPETNGEILDFIRDYGDRMSPRQVRKLKTAHKLLTATRSEHSNSVPEKYASGTILAMKMAKFVRENRLQGF